MSAGVDNGRPLATCARLGRGGDRVRLRAGLPVLWHGPAQVRIGTDPRWAVVLDDLSPSAAPVSYTHLTLPTIYSV